MRILIQRVSEASITVDGVEVGRIGEGLLLFVGIGHNDTKDEAKWMAFKTAGMRIFEDADGKTNLSLLDVGCEALVVSQFTLYADTRKGRRPSFIRAARPTQAEPLVRYFAEQLEVQGVPVQHGEFGAYMKVSLVNEGPLTIWVERERQRERSSEGIL